METYRELFAQKCAIEAKMADAYKAESEQAIASVRATISVYGLTATDCGFEPAQSPANIPPMGEKKRRRKALPGDGWIDLDRPVKYRGPNGEMWTGRGRPPKWISDIEKAGGSRADYLINIVVDEAA